MNNEWIDRWNERYSKPEYAYGTEPNSYLKEKLNKFKPGKILFPAEGEGRNAVFAALRGWRVFAFDISIEGRKKALELALKNGVNLHYSVGDLNKIKYETEQFDALVFIYAHFPPEVKLQYLNTLYSYLKPGGVIIFEAFGKKHLDYVRRDEKVGGPRDADTLYSRDEIESCFTNCEIIESTECEIELKEGVFHNGLGSVVRFTAIKK
ncbi:MAG: class I SAM-dependent methyltransferase [Flavobacteriales bacterium]|nr:class I SAM-dependent methyltransferase [Flavobacteriales bacterium]